jgi:uncharacterized phage infection (PIP) family protein YhgE
VKDGLNEWSEFSSISRLRLCVCRKIVNESPASLPANLSSELRFLIMKMLEKDPTKRPSIDQMLQYSPVKLRRQQSQLMHTVENMHTRMKHQKQYVEDMKQQHQQVTVQLKLQIQQEQLKATHQLQQAQKQYEQGTHRTAHGVSFNRDHTFVDAHLFVRCLSFVCCCVPAVYSLLQSAESAHSTLVARLYSLESSQTVTAESHQQLFEQYQMQLAREQQEKQQMEQKMRQQEIQMKQQHGHMQALYRQIEQYKQQQQLHQHQHQQQSHEKAQRSVADHSVSNDPVSTPLFSPIAHRAPASAPSPLPPKCSSPAPLAPLHATTMMTAGVSPQVSPTITRFTKVRRHRGSRWDEVRAA